MASLTRKLLVAVAASASFVAHADVLTFDDLPGGAYSFFASNYGGFQFGTNNTQTTAWFHTKEASPYYKPHSGTVYASTDFNLYNGTPLQATQAISNTVKFTFDGAWFSGVDPIQYKLYEGGALVYTSTPSDPLTNVSTFIASGYAGPVNQVVILGTQGYYAMDDFTFSSAVPEPSDFWLLALGLFGLGCFLQGRSR